MPRKVQQTQCFFCGSSAFASAAPKFPTVRQLFTIYDRNFLFGLNISHE